MLPNLRLVIATIFSTATLAFFFVSFASFRIAHDDLVRLPSSSVPAIQQLGFAADEMWSQHDSLNGAVPAIFRSLPQAFLGSGRDANARMPQIPVIEVPAAPEPEPAAVAVNEADVPAETAPAPAAVAEAPRVEAPIAEPPVEPAPPQAVAMNDLQAAVTSPAPAEAVPLPTPAPTVAERTAAKKATQATAKTAPKAKTAKRAAKTPARPRRRVAAKPAAPASAVMSPAAARPGAKTTSSTNTTANGPFSSLFR